MTRIGLLSDTHGFIDEKILAFFENCDEIWHAGDIGTIEIFDYISSIKPLRAVYGNIDNHKIRTVCKESIHFKVEGINVLMTHIGGTPKRYDPRAKLNINKFEPDLFICGHSHILRIQYDKIHNFLYVNPGAAGNQGFHGKKTAVRFEINEGNINNMEIFETNRRFN